jgi:hypothetical protein
MSPVTVRSPRPMMNSTADRTLLSSTPRFAQHLGRDALALADQTEEEMLGPM